MFNGLYHTRLLNFIETNFKKSIDKFPVLFYPRLHNCMIVYKDTGDTRMELRYNEKTHLLMESYGPRRIDRRARPQPIPGDI